MTRLGTRPTRKTRYDPVSAALEADATGMERGEGGRGGGRCGWGRGWGGGRGGQGERAGRQTGKHAAAQMPGKAEVLRSLGNILNMSRPEHHSIDRLKERGVEKGSGRRLSLRGQERPMLNQTYTGTVSRATFGREGVCEGWGWGGGGVGRELLRDGVGERMGLSERYDAI